MGSVLNLNLHLTLNPFPRSDPKGGIKIKIKSMSKIKNGTSDASVHPEVLNEPRVLAVGGPAVQLLNYNLANLLRDLLPSPASGL